MQMRKYWYIPVSLESIIHIVLSNSFCPLAIGNIAIKKEQQRQWIWEGIPCMKSNDKGNMVVDVWLQNFTCHKIECRHLILSTEIEFLNMFWI